MNLIITRVSAAAFMGTILRSFSALLADQCSHQHHYLRYYTKRVVAKNSPNIGFCQKIKAESKGTGKKLLIGLTLLHSTHRKNEINLLDIVQKCSISFVINKIDLKADINTTCIQNNISDCHTENEVRCDVRYVLATL